MIYPEGRGSVAAFFRRTLEGQKDVHEFRMVTASGQVLWLRVASRPEWDESHTRIERLFGAASDITERKHLELAMEYQAWHDPLTELANRRMFHRRLEDGMLAARQSSKPLALLLVDLDRFKAVNDTLGHETGDLVLRHTAERLLGMVLETDTYRAARRRRVRSRADRA